MTSRIDTIKTYIKSLRLEMQSVTWPTWAQVRSTVAVVLFTIFAFAAYLGAIDAILKKLFDVLLGVR